MSQSNLRTPISTTESDTKLRKRELSSPFSPEDKILKKNKSAMAHNISETEHFMEADTETVTEVLSQTHMLTLPESELVKLGDLIKPSIHGNVLAEIRSDLKSMIKEVVSELLDDKLSPLRKENERLVKENTALVERITKLEVQMDDAEQYSRRNCLRISNFLESPAESTDRIVLQIAETLNVAMSPSEIDRSHRIGKPGSKQHRDIIIKFTSYRARERIYTNRSKLKGSDFNGVFVNEDLTRNRSKMLYEARKLVNAEEPRLLGAWSSDGKILIKDLDSKVYKITTEDCLKSYISVNRAEQTAPKTAYRAHTSTPKPGGSRA